MGGISRGHWSILCWCIDTEKLAGLVVLIKITLLAHTHTHTHNCNSITVSEPVSGSTNTWINKLIDSVCYIWNSRTTIQAIQSLFRCSVFTYTVCYVLGFGFANFKRFNCLYDMHIDELSLGIDMKHKRPHKKHQIMSSTKRLWHKDITWTHGNSKNWDKTSQYNSFYLVAVWVM